MIRRSTFEEWEVFLSFIDNANSIDLVMSYLSDRMRILGFSECAYWLRWHGNTDKKPLIISTYPESFLNHYVEQNYSTHDMVGRLSLNTNRPFAWGEIQKRYPITRKQKLIFHDSSNVGLNQGGSVPIHGPNMMKATFSVASNLQQKEFESMFYYHQHEIHILATAAHEKMVSLGLDDDKKCEELTSRETEILVWISRGYTYSEISDKLFIQEDTVKKHMQSIFRKLHVSNGPHASATAIINGLIVP